MTRLPTISLDTFRDALERATRYSSLTLRERARVLALGRGRYAVGNWHNVTYGCDCPLAAAGVYDPDDPKFAGVAEKGPWSKIDSILTEYLPYGTDAFEVV